MVGRLSGSEMNGADEPVIVAEQASASPPAGPRHARVRPAAKRGKACNPIPRSEPVFFPRHLRTVCSRDLASGPPIPTGRAPRLYFKEKVPEQDALHLPQQVMP